MTKFGDDELTLFANPDAEDCKEVERMLRQAEISYCFVPVYTLELTKGLYRAQTMEEIKELIESYE